MSQSPNDQDVRALNSVENGGEASDWTVESVRESDAEVLSLQRPLPPDVRATHTSIAGVPVNVYHPPNAVATTLVYLHGGGFVIGSKGYVEPVMRLTREARCTVVMPELSLAPEYPFPTALNEARTVIEAICSDPERHGLASGSIGLVGDSSGGNLTAIVARELQARGHRLAFQVLMYPMLDADPGADPPDLPDTGSFSAAKSEWYFDQYLSSGEDRRRPDVSPLRSRYIDASPPTLVIVPGLDPLRRQAFEYADLLSESGVETTVWLYPGTVHGFFQMDDMLRSSRRLSDDLAWWILQRKRAEA